jgi:hypothetical protein
MKRLPVVALLTLMVLAQACSGSATPALPTAVSSAAAGSSAGATVAAPAKADTPPAAAVTTTMGPGQATITGVLRQGAGSPKPAVGVVLALAPILPNAAGTPAAARFDRTTAPETITDADGRFVFAGIKPQPYALILDRVVESYLLREPSSGDDMIWSPKAGQVLNVGNLDYASLPGESAAP